MASEDGSNRMASDDEAVQMDGVDDPKDETFKLVFEQTLSFRNLIEIIKQILNVVTIYVTKNDTFEGIQIESIDSKHVCFIVAKLACTVESIPKNGAEFCVNTEQLNNILKGVPHHYTIDVQTKEMSSDIFLYAYESVANSSFNVNARLSTLNRDAENVSAVDFAYEYEIAMDLKPFNMIIHQTQLLKAKDMVFKIEEPKYQSSNVRYTVFTIHVEGATASQDYAFHSVTTEDSQSGSTCIIRTDEAMNIPKPDNLEVRVEETFSAEFLGLFTRHMDRHSVVLRITECSENQPQRALVVNYSFGCDPNSFVSLFLAPKTKHDE